jgi:hypothetical protein
MRAGFQARFACGANDTHPVSFVNTGLSFMVGIDRF